jgi:hypothetical protein
MRLSILTALALLGVPLCLAACADQAAPGTALSPAAMTGSAQAATPTGGVTFRDPASNPPGNYTGSQRGTSNSPIKFRRDPAQMPGAAAPAAQ